ncbi:MAG: diadenylate cyclase [Clostridia bacterium]|nr:diadenylate cyclase [Clostridia bacterium]
MTFQEFMAKVGATFTGDAVTMIITLVMLFTLFYFTIRILSKNNARWVIFVFIFYILATGTVFMFAGISGWNYFPVPLLFIVAVVSLFATEIKRGIWKVRKKKTGDVKIFDKSQNGMNYNNKNVDEIVKALLNMSKNNVGAIIIFSNEKIPNSIIESGTILNASISSQLIESVFYPKAPLHDGAMIIMGDKVYAAGCFLPLSQELNLPKELGSRHRAGIGVTEAISVTAIIVSEENGIISIAQSGKISRYADSEKLRQTLHEYFWQSRSEELGVKEN